MGGLTIGNGAIVGAGSIVTKDVPPYAVVAGSPARIIRYRFPREMIDRLEAIRWWRFGPWDLEGIDFSNLEGALPEISARESRGEIRAWNPIHRTLGNIEDFLLGPEGSMPGGLSRFMFGDAVAEAVFAE